MCLCLIFVVFRVSVLVSLTRSHTQSRVEELERKKQAAERPGKESGVGGRSLSAMEFSAFAQERQRLLTQLENERSKAAKAAQEAAQALQQAVQEKEEALLAIPTNQSQHTHDSIQWTALQKELTAAKEAEQQANLTVEQVSFFLFLDSLFSV